MRTGPVTPLEMNDSPLIARARFWLTWPIDGLQMEERHSGRAELDRRRRLIRDKLGELGVLRVSDLLRRPEEDQMEMLRWLNAQLAKDDGTAPQDPFVFTARGTPLDRLPLALLTFLRTFGPLEGVATPDGATFYATYKGREFPLVLFLSQPAPGVRL